MTTLARKPSKYRSRKVVADGEVFDSKKEYARWCDLKLLERAGEISELSRQVRYSLIPKQKAPDGSAVRATDYIADFVYTQRGGVIVEDSKSDITRKLAEYRIKKKLMLQVHGIWIYET